MQSQTFAWLMVFSAVFLWGSNFHAITGLNHSPTPLSAAAFRFLLAAAILLLLRAFRKKPESVLTFNQQLKLIILGGIGVFIFNSAMFIGLTMTSALNGALIMGATPAVGLILSRLVFGSRIRNWQWFGLLIGFIGVYLVVTKGQVLGVVLSAGDSFIAISCMSGCLFTVLVKRWLPEVPAGQLTRWTITSGALMIGVFAWLREDVVSQVMQLNIQSGLLLVYMAVAGTVMAYYSWLHGNLCLGPEKTTLAFNLVPVCTLLIGMALGQFPAPVQVLGMVTVLVGMLFTSLVPFIRQKGQTA
ncbi:DMT family transporter [Photobacterium sp. R1]